MARRPLPPSAKRTLALIALAFTLSVTLTVSAVPLYNWLCEVAGIARPQIAIGQQGEVVTTFAPVSETRVITVRFTANTGAGVPIAFHPMSYTMRVPVGQPVLTAYSATNQSPRALDGVAVHMLYAMGGPGGVNVADHISLQQCFCFAQQHYPGNAEVRLPLSFTLLPSLPKGIHTITFSYTLFEALENDQRIKQKPAVVSATVES
jgi:cytochrome c oxidase assembly protein subunit 11